MPIPLRNTLSVLGFFVFILGLALSLLLHSIFVTFLAFAGLVLLFVMEGTRRT